MVEEAIVIEQPSDGWYHIFDHCVLPTMVSPEESVNNPKWWTDERYAIYELSVYSVTAFPAHEEQICLVESPEKYKVQGYAYSSGGRRVTRFEDYGEDRYREVEQDLYGGRLDMLGRENSHC